MCSCTCIANTVRSSCRALCAVPLVCKHYQKLVLGFFWMCTIVKTHLLSTPFPTQEERPEEHNSSDKQPFRSGSASRRNK
uniref:Uncharacterized protein n=1 Tax=Anguilla anguilla TaxID=7936 RepID=A0A0E9SFA3_ANGAN